MILVEDNETMLQAGTHGEIAAEEVRGWLTHSGWQFLERKPLAGPASSIVAETAEHLRHLWKVPCDRAHLFLIMKVGLMRTLCGTRKRSMW